MGVFKKESFSPPGAIPPEILKYYENNAEEDRLKGRDGLLELVRTQELVLRFLPPAPAVIYDIGGGPGVYSCWLAREGYEVHLIDPVPFLVERARRTSAEQVDAPVASLTVGEVRNLDRPSESVDAVLLLGPLYHLTERSDRIAALREAGRVLRFGGVLFSVGISRFASALDGLFRGYLDDPVFEAIVEQDLKDGQHRNPPNSDKYFTTAFFHLPDELKVEIEDAGLVHLKTLAIEGPAWLLQDFEQHWSDAGRRERLLKVIRALEEEPGILGISSHILAVARKEH